MPDKSNFNKNGSNSELHENYPDLFENKGGSSQVGPELEKLVDDLETLFTRITLPPKLEKFRAAEIGQFQHRPAAGSVPVSKMVMDDIPLDAEISALPSSSQKSEKGLKTMSNKRRRGGIQNYIVPALGIAAVLAVILILGAALLFTGSNKAGNGPAPFNLNSNLAAFATATTATTPLITITSTQNIENTVTIKSSDLPQTPVLAGLSPAPTPTLYPPTTAPATPTSSSPTPSSPAGVVPPVCTKDGTECSYLLSHKVNITQTIGAYSVTINWIYADGNAILIGITVNGPSSSDPAVINTYSVNAPDAMIDANFKQFDGKVITSAKYGSPVIWDGLQRGGFRQIADGKLQSVYEFGVDSVTGNPAQFNLHFEINRLSVRKDPTTPTPTVKGGPSEQTNFIPLNEPFKFELPVKYTPGRIVEPDITLSSGSAKLTLKRLVITPYKTRIELVKQVPKEGSRFVAYPENEQPVGTLVVDGKVYSLPGGGGNPKDPTPVNGYLTGFANYELLGPALFYSPPGEWKLEVQEVSEDTLRRMFTDVYLNQLTVTPKPDEITGGTWTFKFPVP